MPCLLMPCSQPKQVVRIDRPYGDSPPQIPSTNINYHRDLCEVPFRSDIKPLDIVQPQGACWTVSGQAQKPKIRLYIYIYTYISLPSLLSACWLLAVGHGCVQVPLLPASSGPDCSILCMPSCLLFSRAQPPFQPPHSAPADRADRRQPHQVAAVADSNELQLSRRPCAARRGIRRCRQAAAHCPPYVAGEAHLLAPSCQCKKLHVPASQPFQP